MRNKTNRTLQVQIWFQIPFSLFLTTKESRMRFCRKRNFPYIFVNVQNTLNDSVQDCNYLFGLAIAQTNVSNIPDTHNSDQKAVVRTSSDRRSRRSTISADGRYYGTRDRFLFRKPLNTLIFVF